MITSTYRLQIRASFDLHAAADVCDHLATLGVGAVYLSPLLPSAKGSDHGYDVVRFDAVDPARGGSDGWTRLLAAARARGLRVVVDIVPNHAGVADAAENPAWWDVLKLGRDSAYASWFDIDWSQGRLLLPVLGDSFSPDELTVDEHGGEPELRYFEHRFPIAPGTGEGSPAEIADRQHYQLVNFRRADVEQNYRRFFAVVTLAGLRVEDPAVFDATHAQIARWVRDDGIDGLRVDHPDGLVDPLGYLTRLRELAGPDAWLTVEKILEPGEELPPEWPVDGTTGYDALAEVGGLFVDPAAEADLDALYRALTGDELSFAGHVERGKRTAATTILQAEINRLAALAPDVERAADALAELVIRFPVYRSYLPTGARYLTETIQRSRPPGPISPSAIAALAPRLSDPADELCARFQQVTGAVMAKGVEDTAYYRYTRFIALNEVGGDPARFGLGLDGVPRNAGDPPGHPAAQHDDPVHPRHQTRRGRAGPARGAGRTPCRVGRVVTHPDGRGPRPRSDIRLSALADVRRGRADRSRPDARVRRKGDARSGPVHQLDRPGRGVREVSARRHRSRVRRRRRAHSAGHLHRPDHALRLDELARPEARATHHAWHPGRVPGHRPVGGLAGRSRQPPRGRLGVAPVAARRSRPRGHAAADHR